MSIDPRFSPPAFSQLSSTNRSRAFASAVVSESESKNMVTDSHRTALLGGYQELCKSYHSIDDFRMKLLGLLPLTSLVGIFGLGNDVLLTQENPISRHLITFVAIFAAAFTLALFVYEIRGILRCSDLIRRGRDIEALLEIEGQFFVCVKEHECKETGRTWRERMTAFFDAKLAACVIYSTVFAAWVFAALRFGLGKSIYGCALTAVLLGILLGVGAFLLVKKLVPA
ncbi:MAG: hypothetical protein ACRD8U_24590 [Pyrinomonadaceae bacterium]